MLPENKPREIVADKRVRMFVYGEPFSGKTTFASKFPNPIILSTDGNYDLLETPAITLSSTKEWLDAIAELESGKHTYETVIIDVVDQFFDIYREEFLRSKGKEHETDLNMKGWEMVRKPFKHMLYRLASLPYNVIFIGHSKDKTMRDRFGIETTITTYVLPDELAKYITSVVKAAFFTQVEKAIELDDDGNKVFTKKYYLYLNAIDDSVKGGSRILFKKDKIELNYEEFMSVLKDSVDNPITEKTMDKKAVKEAKPLKALKPIDKPSAAKTVTDVWS